MPAPSLKTRLSEFTLVGAVGFVTDGGLLVLLHDVYGINPYASRCVSFPVAMTVTWLLNRWLTFADRKDSRAASELGRYAVVAVCGALLNMLIFFALVRYFSFMSEIVLLPFAIASGIALVFNFLGSQHFVFTHQNELDET
ncbi:MAG: GtrA family protein [Pseudomonadota bacterium]